MTQDSMTPHYVWFRFSPVNKNLLDSLTNSNLHFSTPKHLNDPFDCQVDIRAAFTNAAAQTTGKKQAWLTSALAEGDAFLKTWPSIADETGICCFSLELLNTLMWAHYADGHKGVCLCYSMPPEFITDNTLGAVEVTYAANPLTRWLIDFDNQSLDLGSFMYSFPKLFFAIKAPAWRYEKEARLIWARPNNQGNLFVPKGLLKQVTFGMKITNRDKTLVQTLAREHCGCESFSRIVHDGKSDFGLDAVPI